MLAVDRPDVVRTAGCADGVSTMKEWLTVAEAALVVGRHPRNVYRWIEKGILRSETAIDGSFRVPAKDVIRVESVTKRGRPKGSARAGRV